MNDCYVIAEIAQGAEGNSDRIKMLIDAASHSGANAIKFQVYQTDELVEKSHPEYSLFEKWEFSRDQWEEVLSKIPENLDVWCDVFGEASFKLAADLDIKGIKIHSSDINNYPLLKLASRYDKQIMLGVGGSHLIEIYRALSILQKPFRDKRIILMPGIQVFPTKLESNNLNVIADLISKFNLPVGFADHLDGDDPFAITLPALAVLKGAAFIEKHLTILRKDKWEDYQSALEPEEFKMAVNFIKHTVSLENTKATYIETDDEKKYRKYSKKLLLAKNELAAGTTISSEDVFYKRVTNAESNTANYHDVIGNQITAEKFHQGLPVLNSDVKQKVGLLVIVRMASTRLENKALLKIGEHTTLEFLINRLKLSSFAENITLCTTTNKEDDILIELAVKNNISFVRGSEKNILDRLIKAIDQFGYTHIARITGDDLLRDYQAMDMAIKEHLEKNVDYTWMEGLPYGTDTEIISSRFIKEIALLAEEPDNTEYLTWFTYDQNINSIHKLYYKYPEHYRLTLDTADDYEVFKMLNNEFKERFVSVTTKELVDFLDSNKAIAEINSKIKPKLDQTKINTRLDFLKGLYEAN